MKTIIAGSRDFCDQELLFAECDKLQPQPTFVLSGTAAGADSLGELWAKARGIQVLRYPADWKRYGKAAGYKRNEVMANNAERLIAFWDGASHGTRNMIQLAEERKLKISIVVYNVPKA